MSLPDLRAAALALPPETRFQLAEELLDSLTPTDPELTAAQWAEVERRRADLAANPAAGRPWDEAYARLKARYGG